MKLVAIVLSLSVGASLVACSKKKNEEPAATGSAAGSAAGSAEAPKKQFTGPLTLAVLSGAAREIQVYTPDGKPAPFAAALAQAKTVIGEPTRVEGTKYQWGVVEGDRCAFYVLEDAGGTAKSPGTATVASDDAECLAATGKAPADGPAAEPATGSAGSAAGSAAK
ncbi:MAG TPA: hypothetical protein VM513_36850 [Kofleriaceae bacterium]|jgi:hypothetical protein|nr:hypothetical protein [Kofleriaceae bacterium]